MKQVFHQVEKERSFRLVVKSLLFLRKMAISEISVIIPEPQILLRHGRLMENQFPGLVMHRVNIN